MSSDDAVLLAQSPWVCPVDRCKLTGKISGPPCFQDMGLTSPVNFQVLSFISLIPVH